MNHVKNVNDAVTVKARMITMPDIIQTLKDLYATDKTAALNMLPELFRQVDEGQILPYKIGTTVHKITKLLGGDILIVEGKVVEYIIAPEGTQFYFSNGNREHDIWCDIGCFGKTVFLTREAAEKALKESKHGN